jgi:hypothetical protein
MRLSVLNYAFCGPLSVYWCIYQHHLLLEDFMFTNSASPFTHSTFERFAALYFTNITRSVLKLWSGGLESRPHLHQTSACDVCLRFEWLDGECHAACNNLQCHAAQGEACVLL